MSQATVERFYSVDIETSGPIPGEYSMLSLGACVVTASEVKSETFARRFKPLSRNADPEALKVSGLALDDLEREGTSPVEAMRDFADWVAHTTGEATPVFIGFNASFDWSFVNYYFHRFLGHNPFGFAALDIKSFYMGIAGCAWYDTRSSAMIKVLNPTRRSNHNALDDALAQAELFQLARSLSSRKS